HPRPEDPGPARIGDQGEYTCQCDRLNRPAGSAKAFLRVLKNLDGLKTDAANQFLIVVEAGAAQPDSAGPASGCVPEFSKQKVEKRQFEQPIKGSVWIEKQELKDKLFTVTSVLEIDGQSVTDARHNLLIECHAKVLNFELRPMSASTRLYVTAWRSKPHRQNNEYHEHDRVTAVCTATGRPDKFCLVNRLERPPASPRWAPSTSALTLTTTRRRHGPDYLGAAQPTMIKSDAEARDSSPATFEPSLPTLYSARDRRLSRAQLPGGRPDRTADHAWREGRLRWSPQERLSGASTAAAAQSWARCPACASPDCGRATSAEYVCTVSGRSSHPSRGGYCWPEGAARCESARQPVRAQVFGRSFRARVRRIAVRAPRRQRAGGVQCGAMGANGDRGT
uniref:Ig-like domain-containing protein n=1 Tax=Macrostomum lignano TaxID=282301 RepID=A0A1I8FPD3_9PLAT